MTGKSHLVAGTMITATTLQQTNYVQEGIWFWVALGVGMIASLLPDTDSQNPMIKSQIKGGGKPRLTNKLIGYQARKKFPMFVVYAVVAGIELVIRYSLSGLIGIIPGLVKHRGPTHYLITAITFTVLIWYVTKQLGVSHIYAVAFGAGYVSHIFCDTMTKTGVRLFAPVIPRKSFHSLPRPLRLTTGSTPSLSEYVALACIGLLCAFSFVLQPSIYLPATAVVIIGMFVMTAVYDRLHPQRQIRQQGKRL